MASVSTPSNFTSATPRRIFPALSTTFLIAITGVLFILQLRHFSPFLTDDAYISLRYSQRLLEGHGLTWNDMRPVEGYTNFLWVLLCAGLGALGIPLPLAAHLLGITTTLAIVVAVAVYVYRNYPEDLKFISALIACCALVLSSTFSMWALGGLEQPLLSCMLVWAAFLMLGWLSAERPSTSTAVGIGVLLGFAVISRADAAVFVAAFYAAAVIADGVGLRSLLSRARILPIPILFFVGQLAFRKAYYHEWLPNTAFVKVAFTAHRVYTGIRYVCFAVRADCVYLVLVAVGAYALWRARKKKTVVFLLTVATIWTVYVIVVGGDIFPAYRHFEPIVALFGFVVAGCGLLAVDAAGKWKRGSLAGLLAVTALVSTSDAMTDQEHWELQGESLGLFLHQAFGEQQPLLSSDAAGVVPYYAHMPVLDPLGLNDYHIAHEASRSRGYGWVGHELGDGKYILDQKPDLMLFSSFEGDGPLFPADEQIEADPRFAQYYQAIRFDTPQPYSLRALMYIRRMDGKLGIEEQDGKVVIPGYLAKADLTNSVHLVDGKAALVVAANGHAEYERIPLPAGDWDVSADGNGPTGLQLVKGANTAIVLDNEQDKPLTVRSITLTRKK